MPWPSAHEPPRWPTKICAQASARRLMLSPLAIAEPARRARTARESKGEARTLTKIGESEGTGDGISLRSSDTKPRERLLFSPLEDEPAIENLPEPIPLTPEQIVAQSEADERDRQRQREWALVVQALNDNSLAVVRAMRRFRSETEQEQVERVLTSYEAGSFLIDRLGAGLVVDQDLAVVLLDLRRRLIEEYGDT